MKNRSIGFGRICACVALIGLCALAVGPALAADDGSIPPLIRLHVLAASDAEADQNRKLIVRDAVLRETEALLGECDTYAQAYCMLDERLDDVLAAARGASDGVPVRAELTTETYPDREYASFTLPAGEYTSLKVTLGEGEGHNWWCVVYPSLCGLDEVTPAPIAEARPLRFGLLDWIRDVFGWEAVFRG